MIAEEIKQPASNDVTAVALEEPTQQRDLIEEPVDPEQMEDVRIPNLLRAALILFAVNLCLLIWFCASPNFKLGSAAPEESPMDPNSYSSKMSPFTEVVKDTPRRVKTAQKLKPVLYTAPPAEPDPQTASLSSETQSVAMMAVNTVADTSFTSPVTVVQHVATRIVEPQFIRVS